ncbi:type IV pilus biogenesis protein PilP [Roseateles sp. SL47]|uniref:type IV pilus biogenesis protein PilP n=1 Tax=Roseateles sp. SL47 TaxID=2995138 RepID=UPI00226EE693|nr:type IV pilus biogenesis protein PilP [Roseateles sp. SL47]WAC74559.1 type IV pilus biogenesis protein PilP [Roseateles sp. SL47]
MRNDQHPRIGGFWLLAAAVALACWAAPSAQAGTTAEELAQIEAEHVVLKARLRLAETRALIAARQAEIDRQAPFTPNGLPTVLGIDGMGSRMSATLAMDNGYVTEVAVGDPLPGGARVVAIAAQGVTVQTSDRKRVRLRTGGEPASEMARVMPAPMSALPAQRVAPAAVPPAGVLSMSPVGTSAPAVSGSAAAAAPTTLAALPAPRAPGASGVTR